MYWVFPPMGSEAFNLQILPAVLTSPRVTLTHLSRSQKCNMENVLCQMRKYTLISLTSSCVWKQRLAHLYQISDNNSCDAGTQPSPQKAPPPCSWDQ